MYCHHAFLKLTPPFFLFVFVLFLKSSGGGNSSKNDFRRKWDKDEYEQLAQKRLDEERDKKDGNYPFAPVTNTWELTKWKLQIEIDSHEYINSCE